MQTLLRRTIAMLCGCAVTCTITHLAQAQVSGPSSAPTSSPSVTASRDLKNPTNDGVAPDIKVEALWDGRKMMPFHTLDFPVMITAIEATALDDSDYVLGVTANGEGRAYPTRYVWFHHGINDHIGKQQAGGEIPIAVTYCSVCNTGICYDPTVNGKPVLLDFYGLYNGVVTLCERETQSIFLQAEGRFAAGSLVGTRLKSLPLLDTTWGEWKQLHPDTLVMSSDTPYARFYSPKNRPEPRGYDHFPAPYFRPTVTRGDLRLPPFDKVLGVTVEVATRTNSAGPPAEHFARRAYPLSALEQRRCVVNDKLGKAAIAVFLDPETRAAVAVNRVLQGKTLTFESRRKPGGKVEFYDRQTHSRWNLEGRADDGPLAGKTLEPVENNLSQWYGWAAYFPDTSIYGKRGRPQPGDPFVTQPGPSAPPRQSAITAGPGN